MFTAAAARSIRGELATLGVASRADLRALDVAPHVVTAQIRARRWRRCGLAIVLHNGALSADERWRAALINCGPRSVLTSFTAAESFGLRGWEREAIHVLAPAGTRRPAVEEFAIRLHLASSWRSVDQAAGRRIQRVAPAALVAASSFPHPRPACGLLAAVVQQRLATPAQLRQALNVAPRVRHRGAMICAVDDICAGRARA